MAAIKNKNAVRRYGTRYGLKVRMKVGKIESEQRSHHKCQFCSKLGVKRVSYGIWECKKCGAKFTGRAYSPASQVAKEQTESVEQEKIEKAEVSESEASE